MNQFIRKQLDGDTIDRGGNITPPNRYFIVFCNNITNDGGNISITTNDGSYLRKEQVMTIVQGKLGWSGYITGIVELSKSDFDDWHS